MEAHLIQGTDEWLKMRKSHVGGSDAAPILGVSPYKTAYQLWEEKLDLSDQFQHPYMRRGVVLEEKARERLAEEYLIKVTPKVVFHPQHSWMVASLDGITEDGKTIVEIKCSGSKYHQEALQGNIPEHYKAQLQHQMACTGLDKALYYSFDGEEGILLEMKRDDAYIADMIAREGRFYECMMSMVPPPMSEKDYVEKEDAEWKELARQWAKMKEREAQAAHDKKILREKFISLANGRNARGAGVKVFKSTRQGTVDYSKIEALNGIDLDKYRKPDSEVWTVA